MILFLFSISACGSLSVAFDTFKLKAVISFPGLDQLYTDLHENDRSRILPFQQPDDPATKLKICHFIFSSVFFDMNGEEPVPLNRKETYNELKEHYPKLFNELYEGGPSSSKKTFKRYFSFKNNAGIHEKPAKYFDENYYRKRTVWSEGYPTKETVFSCLTRNRRTKKIRQYFVSNLYNVNKQLYIPFVTTGCFVFTFDKRNDLVIYAMAEEAAEPALLWHSMERNYVFKRESRKPASSPRDDPMCQLSKAEKLRLCNQLLSASVFEDVLRFYPTFANVEDQCRKRRVFFVERYTKARTRNAIYEEWMIGCKTSLIGRNEPLTLYVSRGYSDHSAFLYLEDNQRFYMIYYSSFVSVWQ